MKTETFVAIWTAAQEKARASLVKGQKFLGAWGIAEAMGYAKDSHEFDIASSAAYNVFKNEEIWTDKDGNLC